jgi:hypothetical protein
MSALPSKTNAQRGLGGQAMTELALFMVSIAVVINSGSLCYMSDKVDKISKRLGVKEGGEQ